MEIQAPAGRTVEVAASAPKPAKKKKRSTPLEILLDACKLVLKIVLIVAAFLAVFTFVFGAYRVQDSGMVPSMRDGDLVMYYRLDKDYDAGDVVALRYDGHDTAGRVVAQAGDEVDIDYRGLKVNGSYQQEKSIYFDTTQVVDGVTFPLTVPDGTVFLLGDERTQAVDSRIYGCVPVEETSGQVMMVLRRREF